MNAVDRNIEHRPGDTAPTTGHYEELNVFGARTGALHHVKEGEPLPGAPRGFVWRLVEDGDYSGTL
jgi:hypothetical protein